MMLPFKKFDAALPERTKTDLAFEEMYLQSHKYLDEKINSATMKAYIRTYYDTMLDEMDMAKLAEICQINITLGKRFGIDARAPANDNDSRRNAA